MAIYDPVKGRELNIFELLWRLVGYFFTTKVDLIKEFFAELIGTAILVVFGDGSVAQSVLSRGNNGEILSINWAWAMGVVLGVYFAGGISGAHINPAVTIAMATIGRFPWKKVVFYIIAQFLGAFVAAACVYGVYSDALDAFDGGVRQVFGENSTAGIFATYPQGFLSISKGFGDQVFGTALLLGCILAITDKRNTPPPKGMEPLMIGLVVFVIGLTFGFNCGYAINPARDLGPRIFTALAGYGPDVWLAYPGGPHWWWVPVIAPIIGAICGCLIYIFTIELHHPPDENHGRLKENGAEEYNMKTPGETDAMTKNSV